MTALRSSAFLLAFAVIGTAHAATDNSRTVQLSTGSLLRLRQALQSLVQTATHQPAEVRDLPLIPDAGFELAPTAKVLEESPKVREELARARFTAREYLQTLGSFNEAVTQRELTRRAGHPAPVGMVSTNIVTLDQNRSETRDILRLIDRLSVLQRRAE